jgi:DNA-binding transcriptional regulator YiaG
MVDGLTSVTPTNIQLNGKGSSTPFPSQLPDQGVRERIDKGKDDRDDGLVDTAKLSRARRLASNGAARSLRQAARISLPEIATEVGVAVSTIWRWENGQRQPRGEAAERYSDILDRLMRS